MTLTTHPPVETEDNPPPRPLKRGTLVDYLISVDHKQIGITYIVMAFVFFLVGGLLAMGIRSELAEPGVQFVGRDTYNQLFTMHGTIMVFMFAMPVFTGFANCIFPLQIGAPDMAFPRMNALSLWLFLGGGFLLMISFFTNDGAADFGWTGYAPLSTSGTVGSGGDLWVMGLLVSGIGTLLSGVNFITTIICFRAPGMTMFRMPIFTWNILVTSFLVILAFPPLTAALATLYLDREVGTHFYDATAGGAPILWQHLFWFFGHPEVYILVLPFFGMVTEVIPVFSRKPVFGYKAFVFATLAIAAYSITTWAHHMFSTGAVLLAYFSATTLLIAVPTGVKVFNWIATMWRGQIIYKTPMIWAIGFLVVFVIGGLSGPMLAVAALDFHVTDTYFVVAHFHYVLFGGAVFAMFSGFYFWWPKITGHMLNETLGKLHFWGVFIGFNLTFFPQHLLGLRGMPRRYVDYQSDQGFNFLNMLSSIGAFITLAGMLIFVLNLYVSRRQNIAAGDDPWGGYSLEWATSSPAPAHNFDKLPLIRSERPVFDARHPELQHVHRKG
jgi:cytochrome c oxidase subunit I